VLNEMGYGDVFGTEQAALKQSRKTPAKRPPRQSARARKVAAKKKGSKQRRPRPRS
jgi:hypothetical protein